MNNKFKQDKLKHPSFPQPLDLDTKVWRYFDISKLIDLLSRKSLFLSRADLLGDEHEGSLTKSNFISRNNYFQSIGMHKTYPSLEEVAKLENKTTFINCWYFDNHESEAMWKIYCPDNKGVAIQTTYRKLVQSVKDDDFLFIGKITYVDYETEEFPNGNTFYPIMHKRKAFQFENEIRLVKSEYRKYFQTNSEVPPAGIYHPFNVQEYIDNIYVNPYAQEWYFKVVEDLIRKYNYQIKIQWSSMKVAPYY